MTQALISEIIGTGWSYVEEGAEFTRNNSQIAADLVNFLSDFTAQHPAAAQAPLHIVCESYGRVLADTQRHVSDV